MQKYRPTLLSMVALLLMAAAIFGFFDKVGANYTESAVKRSLAAFAIARGLNAMISVAQGTEVAIHPAGLGVNFTPGQALDPINDLIERFSWVMLMSAASLGVQQVFLNIASSMLATGLLVFVLVLFILTSYRPNFLEVRGRQYLLMAIFFMLFIRFSVPLSVIGGEFFYRIFLSEQYIESTQKLENTQTTLNQLNQELHNTPTNRSLKDPSFIDKAKDYLSSAAGNLNYSAKLQEYKSLVSEVSLYAINLIVVFLTQTVIFPILFLWLLYKGMHLMAEILVSSLRSKRRLNNLPT